MKRGVILKGLAWAVAAYSATGAFNADAALVNVGGGLINDTDINVTWTQDANLFDTLASNYINGRPAFVSAVIGSVGGVITDTPNSLDYPTANTGSYTLRAAVDFNTSSGEMTWWGAQAFVGYLNSIDYGGYSNWRLPKWTDLGNTGPQLGFTGTDYGYNVNTNASEIAHLFHDELGNVAQFNTSGTLRLGSTGVDYGVVNKGPFTNLQNSSYWLGTEYSGLPSFAWSFTGTTGYLNLDHEKNLRYYGWALRDGLATPVPVPAAIWLLGSGLLGLTASSRRKRA